MLQVTWLSCVFLGKFNHRFTVSVFMFVQPMIQNQNFQKCSKRFQHPDWYACHGNFPWRIIDNRSQTLGKNYIKMGVLIGIMNYGVNDSHNYNGA